MKKSSAGHNENYEDTTKHLKMSGKSTKNQPLQIDTVFWYLIHPLAVENFRFSNEWEHILKFTVCGTTSFHGICLTINTKSTWFVINIKILTQRKVLFEILNLCLFSCLLTFCSNPQMCCQIQYIFKRYSHLSRKLLLQVNKLNSPTLCLCWLKYQIKESLTITSEW